MNGIFKSIIPVLILIFLGSCTAQKQDFTSLHRKWMLVEFKNYSKDFLVKNKANLDLSTTKSPENQYSAFMGCNRMFMTAKFTGNNKVEFSKIGSTMMYCNDNQELEFKFAKELPQMTKYKIEGHFLTLSAENGETMKFVAEDWD